MSFNQKESVFAAVSAFLQESGREVELDSGNAITFSKEDRKTIIGMVTQSALAGEMTMTAEASAKYSDEAKMSGYVNGLVSNWLRKDKRLNGNVDYEIKNPGSRAGAGDDQLKALKALRSTLTDATDIGQLDAAIEARTAEVQASKVKSVTIDVSKLPEEFRHLVK